MGGRFLCVLLVPVLLVAGCTLDRRTPEARWVRDESLPCPQIPEIEERPQEVSQRPASAERLADVPVTSGQLLDLTIWDHYLAYVEDLDRVVVCDLRTGRSTVVVDKVEGSWATFRAPDGSKDVVVYTVSGSPTGTGPVWRDRSWTIEAVDLGTGGRRRIAGGHSDNLPPEAAVDWPWVAWAEPAGERSSVVRTLDLRTGRRRTVVPAAHASRRPDDVQVADGLLVFAEVDGTRARDLFTVPADGSSPPRRLTSQGHVVNHLLGDGRLVWRNAPSSLLVETWTMVVGREKEPTQVALDLLTAIPGSDFLAVLESFLTAREIRQDLPLAVVDLVHPGSPPVPLFDGTMETVDPKTEWDVSGDLVAWATFEPDLEVTPRRHLHIARVVRQ